MTTTSDPIPDLLDAGKPTKGDGSHRRDPYAAGRSSRDAEVAEMRQRIRDLEQQWADSTRGALSTLGLDREFLQQVADSHGVRTDQVTTAYLAHAGAQLAARDAVIERVKAESDWVKEHGSDSVDTWRLDGILDEAPKSVLAEHDSRVLEEAADRWSEWETFVASDGVTSTRQHGKTPPEWLRARATERRNRAGL